jgi:hypothetical protein
MEDDVPNIKKMAKSVASLFESGVGSKIVIDPVPVDTQNHRTILAKGESMFDPITFAKGTGKANRAAYHLGAEKVPAAVITRLLNALSGLSGAKLDRSFYQGLEKYPDFLDALDANGMNPAIAMESFTALQKTNSPDKNSTGQRASKAAKAAELFSKGMCKRFKGSPEEVVDAFLELVAKPEFKTEAVDCITAFKKNFGESTLGFIKTSNRKGNPAAQKALAKARARRKK